MRFRYIEQHAQQFRVGLMCKVLRVSRAGYYAWRKRGPSAQQETDQQLLVLLRRLFWVNRKLYGYRRIHVLARIEVPSGRHRVARLMRQDGLRVSLGVPIE